MRRYASIVRATVLETLSDPLGLLLTMSAMAVIAIASVFHIHQFGEPWRMARDATLSSIFVFGLLQAVFCTIKTIRREIESGILQTILSHPVSRFGYIASKTAGIFAACCVFAAAIAFTGLSTVLGAQAGAELSSAAGDIPKIWRGAVAADAISICVPLAVAAILDRFARVRFVLAASVLLLAVSAASYAYLFWRSGGFATHGEMVSAASRMVPAIVLLLPPMAVFTSAAAAFSTFSRDNIAATLCGALFAVSMPVLGCHYASETLAGGGVLPWSYAVAAIAAALPLVLGFLFVGAAVLERRDAQ